MSSLNRKTARLVSSLFHLFLLCYYSIALCYLVGKWYFWLVEKQRHKLSEKVLEETADKGHSM